MKNIEKDIRQFNAEAKKNNNYKYTVDEQDYDLMNEVFSKLTPEEKAKSNEKAVTFDERMERFGLDS